MDALNFCFKEIAYDNGAVFRGQTEKEVLDRVWLAITKTSTNPEGFSIAELNRVEDELSQLGEDDLMKVALGEYSEQREFIRSRFGDELAELINEILDRAFDNL